MRIKQNYSNSSTQKQRSKSDYNDRGSKGDNVWTRGSSEKERHCGSKVDCKGRFHPWGSQVDTKGWFRNHNGSRLDYWGSQVNSN